jgi:hypothetical protein
VTGIVFLQFYYLLFDAWRVPLIGSYAGFVLAHCSSAFRTPPERSDR